jgi:uncharacterized integral membrane protein
MPDAQFPIPHSQLPITHSPFPIPNIFNMRSVFLLVIVVGLTIFALQNVEPALSLVFLGMRSPALPLSIWILLSMAIGVVTSLLISGLLSFSNYLSQSPNRTDRDSYNRDTLSNDRRTPYAPPPPPRKQEIDPDRNRGNRETQPAAGPRTESRTEYGKTTGYNARTVLQETPVPNPRNAKDYAQSGTSVVADDDDDWVSDGSKINSQGSDDDWGDDREIVDRPNVNEVLEANPRNYEAQQEPKSQSWAGSVYSYGYRDPSKSGVGQTESVYDAEYRVLIPPDGAIPETGNWQVPSNNSEDEEDWGLDDDDELDVDVKPNDKQHPDLKKEKEN